MPDPVLVGVALDDRDSGPIAFGIALAALAGGPLALVHAYPYDPGRIPVPEYEAALRAGATSGLERLAATLPAGSEVTVHAYASVSPARALHAAAATLEPLALVVGSTHRGPLGQVLPGGVGERLLHGAPCPVAITPHGYGAEPAELTGIGVAFDGGAEAREALDAAVELARATRAKVSIFTVSEPVEIAPATMVPGWTVPRGYSVPRQERAEHILESARKTVPPELLGEAKLVTGHAARALADASRDVDLLVCGSRGYGPLSAVLLGGVSGELAHKAACPLLIIPRGNATRRGLAPDAASDAQEIGQ